MELLGWVDGKNAEESGQERRKQLQSALPTIDSPQPLVSSRQQRQRNHRWRTLRLLIRSQAATMAWSYK